jgi:hypothetical protein
MIRGLRWLFMERIKPIGDGEEGHNGGGSSPQQRQSHGSGGPLAPSFLKFVLARRRFSPSLAAPKKRNFCGYGLALKKIDFSLNI